MLAHEALGVRRVGVGEHDLAGGTHHAFRDQGEGFDSEGIGDGFGVENSIVARIESVGGAASIQSAPTAGTIVEITVPTKEEHND